MIIQFTHELKAEVSNPAEEDGFLMAIKIRSTFFFGGEVKPAVPCRKMLNIPTV
jgi:hypothetical protein